MSKSRLYLLRAELKADNRELKSELKADIKQLDSKIMHVDARVSSLDSKITQVDSKVERVLGAVHHLAGEVARIGILVEEQNSKNNIVLEGLTGLAQSQDRLEARVENVEKMVRAISRR